MFDFGFPELLLILIVAVFAIGPKEIPVVMRTLGRVVKRLQFIRYAISQQLDDVINEVNLEDMRQNAKNHTEGDINAEIKEDEDVV